MKVGQDQFTAALFDAALPVPDGLINPEGQNAGERFNVYRNNVAVSLTEALETSFPVVQKLLGDENFRKVASVFLRAHPPSSPLMMYYGQDLPGFLETFPPVAKWGYLPDVARLEAALIRSYHSADAAPLDPSVLQGMEPDALMSARLRFAPAVRLLRSRWPVHALWQYNKVPGSPKPEAEAQDVLVVRPEYDPEPVLLPPGAASLIFSLMEGDPLGAAYDRALSDTPDFDLTTTLGLLLSTSALTGLEISS